MKFKLSKPLYGWCNFEITHKSKTIRITPSYVYTPFSEMKDVLKAIKHNRYYTWEFDQEGSIIDIVFSKASFSTTRVRIIENGKKVLDVVVPKKELLMDLKVEILNFRKLDVEDEFCVWFR